MKKSTIILICILVNTTLISCSYTHSPICSPVTDEDISTANTDESQRDTTNELPDWLEDYIPPLSNQEMMKYGYDENGQLVLTEDQLEHVEDTFSDPYGALVDYDNGGMHEIFERSYVNGNFAGMVLTGTVQSITSVCTRNEDIYRSEKFEIPVVSYQGYTETKFLVTGVLDIRSNDSEIHAHHALQEALIGRVITIKQTPFWYIDDNGTQKKQDSHGYTYVLKPEASSVIWLHLPSYRDEFDKMTTEEQLKLFDTPECGVEDFYPAVNEKDEVIDTFEAFTSYLAYLENSGLTYPVYSPKELHPKIQISY